jgi:alpha-glucosidase
LRIFPSAGAGESTFVLYEDDGISHGHETGEFAEVTFELKSTKRSIELRARRKGDHPVSPIRIVLGRRERRRVTLKGEGIDLIGEEQ